MLPVQCVTRAGVGVICDNVLQLGADLQVKQMWPVTRLWIHACDSGSRKYSCGVCDPVSDRQHCTDFLEVRWENGS